MALGAGVAEDTLFSLVPTLGSRQVPGDDPLVLPGWVRIALGAGIAAAGVVVLVGVVQEARRRLGGGSTQAPVSERTRSIAHFAFSVITGMLFTLVGGLMTLASVGAIRFESGDAPDLPWFMGGIGALVALMALLVTYSAVYRWMGGVGTARRARRRPSV